MSIPNTSVLNNKFFLRTFFKGNFENFYFLIKKQDNKWYFLKKLDFQRQQLGMEEVIMKVGEKKNS